MLPIQREGKIMKKKRNEKLDIIRIFSLICVISVHFFLNSGFYNETVSGSKMLIMCIFRSFFMICVPMFITLTGYLMNKKELNLKYYKEIIKILVIYIICSIIYALYEKCYLNKNINIITFLENILNSRGTKYAWYIEMYIGLFLLIPFLNLIFNNLKDQEQAKMLLITLMILIGAPSLFNFLYFDYNESSYIKIFPDWWMREYPLFYYFLGAYMSKYQIGLNEKQNVILLIIAVVLTGCFEFCRCYKNTFIWGTWNDYQSLVTMIITFLVFNLLLKSKYKTKNNFERSTLQVISNACLGAYLISCIFDELYYAQLNSLVPLTQDRFVYAPLIIAMVLFSSLVVSIIINLFVSKVMNSKKKYKCMNNAMIKDEEENKIAKSIC